MVLASAPINWCRNSKTFGGIRAVSSDPKTSGSNMPFHVTLIKNMTPDATIPASRPARKPTLNGLLLRKNAIFMRRYFQGYDLLNMYYLRFRNTLHSITHLC